MKYEISKGLEEDDNIIWTPIAWSDVLEYAEKVMTAISIVYGYKTAILCNGKVIKKHEC